MQYFLKLKRMFHLRNSLLRFSASKVTNSNSSIPLTTLPEIDLKLIEQLERLSLVEFNNKNGYISLQKSVKSANLLLTIDTDNVEPLATVLEDSPLWLREDRVTEGNHLKEILSNASKVEENYFVAPPGNIPMKKRDKEYLKTIISEKSQD